MMQIGLLEDDVAIQEMLRLVLQDEGYNVIIFPTAEDCLRTLGVLDGKQEATIPVNLLIVDLRLSNSILGTEVIRQVRAVPALEALPIILTTAATYFDIQELQQLHVTVVEKPFDVDKILEIIEDLMQPPLTTKC
jgi:DNA-binding response OmpR family regulator